MIDDQKLVGQEQHEVALVGGAGQAKLHRLELEDEIVAERTVEAEHVVLITGE